MTCPYLDYRQLDDQHEFDHERPWCSIQESFVSPMRADICNDRFAFVHERDCEVYRRATSQPSQLQEASD